MANKTIPALPIYGSQDSDKRKKDLIEITKNDGTYATPTYGTGASRKMSVEELKTALDITSQTVTDGITDKSPSENAVFDAVYAKGLINGTIWVNAYTALGDFNLSIDKYNNVGYTDAEGPISVILPTHTASMSGKTIIVEPHRFNSGLTSVNISIPGLQVDGGGGAGTYTEVITKMGQIVTIQANYYGWHVIGHTNQVPDISFKLDLDGSNANQDIDIDGFGVNAKHFKVNGTGGAGHIGLKHQSANISASASESSIGADSVGDPVWKNDGGAIDKLELQSNKTSTVTGNEASTTKYLTVKGVYDWAVGLFAPKASPTFTGTVTTPDIVVSGATVNTIAHFDATKNIESLPLATYPDLTELSYVKGVTSAIQAQLNAKLSGSGLVTNKLLTYNGTSVASVSGMQISSTWGILLGYEGSVGSSGYYLSLIDPTGSVLLFGIHNTLGTVIRNRIQVGNIGGYGQLICDNNTATFMTIIAGYHSSENVIVKIKNNAQTIDGFTYTGALAALWKSSDNTASTILQKWSNSSDTQIGVLQNGGLYFGTGTKSASALNQLDSTTQGFLPPRMTAAQRTAIASPAIGLMVYCTDTVEGLYVYKSTGWTFIA